MTHLMTPKVAGLLAIDRRNNDQEPALQRFAPALVGILNLLVCAFLDHPIRKDSTGHYLAVFLGSECLAVAYAASALFLRTMSGEIRKTRVLPIRSREYFTAIAALLLRHPLLLAIETTTLFFLVLFAGHTVAGIALCILLTTIAFTSIVFTVALFCLLTVRSQVPLAGPLVTGGAMILGIVLTSVMTNATSLLDATPVVSWLAAAVLAIHRGELSGALRPLFLLTASTIIPALTGWKIR
jgi:hypothetical protein